MSNKEHKKHEAREEPRTGSVAPEDAELTTWLHRLWARDEPPQRLEVWQMFGRNKAVRGEMVHHVDFKPNDRLDVERANKLADEIYAVAQNDCDGAERKSSYQIAIIDHNRRASPLVRRLGPLQPKRTYLMKPDSGSGLGGEFDEDDEDGPLTGKNLGLAYTKENYDQVRWEKAQLARLIGDTMMFQRDTIAEQRTWIGQLMQQHMEQFRLLQEAQNQQLDRDLAREWGKLKVMLARDGIRTARNLLPGLFGPDATGKTEPGPGLMNSNGENRIGTGAVENNHPFIDRFHGSPERALIDGFLSDCEEAGLSIALFGEWEERNGHIVPVEGKPGIFTPQQFVVLVGVRDGKLPPDAIDRIVPGSGDPLAITQEQVVKAQGLDGMTDAIGMSIIELVGLRQRRREAANPKPETEPTEKR